MVEQQQIKSGFKGVTSLTANHLVYKVTATGNVHFFRHPQIPLFQGVPKICMKSVSAAPTGDQCKVVNKVPAVIDSAVTSSPANGITHSNWPWHLPLEDDSGGKDKSRHSAVPYIEGMCSRALKVERQIDRAGDNN